MPWMQESRSCPASERRLKRGKPARQRKCALGSSLPSRVGFMFYAGASKTPHPWGKCLTWCGYAAVV